MIREICSKDKNQIFDLMKTEIKIDHEDFNFDIDHSNKIIAWEDDESKILGFSTFRIWGKEKNKADVYTYVLPSEKRKEFLDNKDNLYLLFENEHLVSSIMVLDNGRIEDLFVTSLAQGNGYGKKTMQFAINKAIENECHPISLSAIEWNSRAVNLYLSLGFEIAQTTRFERLYTGE